MIMPFGKFKGEDIEDLPLEYLYWLQDNCELYDDLEWEVDNAIDLKESMRNRRWKWSR